MQLTEQLHDLRAAGAVQRAGGFIGQQQPGLSHNGAGNGHALALAAGELVRPMVNPVGKAHGFQRGAGTLAPLLLLHAAVQKRQRHIIQRRQLGQQVEGLEHKADLLVAHLGQLLAGAFGNLPATQQIAAGGGHIQAADQVHQRGLAAAGGAHNGQIIPLGHIQIHILQHAGHGFAHGIILADIAHFQNHAQPSTTCMSAPGSAAAPSSGAMSAAPPSAVSMPLISPISPISAPSMPSMPSMPPISPVPGSKVDSS